MDKFGRAILYSFFKTLLNLTASAQKICPLKLKRATNGEEGITVQSAEELKKVKYMKLKSKRSKKIKTLKVILQ